MKRMVCVLGILVAFATVASAAEIAYWNFNNTTNLGGPTSDLWRINPWGTVGAQTDYFKDYGDATGAELSVWQAPGDTSFGNLVGTNGPNPVNNFGSFTGTTLNAQHGDPAGSAFAITGRANNGHYFLIELDDAIEDCILSYATRGTASGYTTHTLEYSTDNGANWTFKETHAAQMTSTWVLHSIDFADVFNATSGHESNLIRLAVSGSTGTPDNGNNRFDNMLVTGTIVPEPASLLLLGLGAVALLRRR